MTNNEPAMLQNRDLARAAGVCARAFNHAPHIEYFFPKETQRESDSAALFKMRICYGLLRGEVRVTSPNLEGVAVWIPSSQAHMTLWGQIRAGGMRLQRTVGNDAVSRMTFVGKHNDQLREQHVADRYVFLSILAIDPEYQHRGYATRLVQEMLTRLDRDHLSCYAETTEQDLVAFYQRLGFKPGGESKIPGTELSVWPLVRAPAS
jgi:ribosomal protein S18 acetylase RimI-like enzyme